MRKAASLDLKPMSTGEPPSGNTSGAEQQSKSGPPSSAGAADKPEARRSPMASVDDDGWDERPPASTGGGKSGVASTSGHQPGRSSMPPISTSSRAKFTVGNLLNATQGSGPSSKHAQGPSPVHRQQIGALPGRPTSRDASAPSRGRSAADQSKASEASRVVSGPQSRLQAPQRKTTPPQPFTAQRADALAEFPVGAAPERTTPSQPFAAFQLEAAPERAARSVPFTALASPMVSVGPDVEDEPSPMAVEAPRATGARSELTERNLLAPELHETTPRGIGVVTVSSPAPGFPTSAAQSSVKVAAAPIIPIATVVIGEGVVPTAPSERTELSDDASVPGDAMKSTRALPAVAVDSATPEQPARASEPKDAVVPNTPTPLPMPVAVKSRPPAAAPLLDDPDGWEVSGSTAAVSSSAELPPPVASQVSAGNSATPATAPVKQVRAAAATRKSAAKAALEKARGSKGKLKSNKPVASEAAPKKSPSSHSKLARAGNAEADLSGDFFAGSATDPSGIDASSYQEELLDERARRSLSPEVVARRGRYRVVVVLVILGLMLLLGAAIALKLMHRR